MVKNARTRKACGIMLILFAAVIVVIAGCSNTATIQQTSVQQASQVRNFTLYVRPVTVVTPDGQKIWSFGFTDDPKSDAKIPGPALIVNEGETVNLTLIDDKDPTKTNSNTTGDGHTIHLHGLDLPSAMDGDPMTAPNGHSVLQGAQFLYHFVAKNAGTYWYHCHQGAAEHIQMGMYGPLIIRPKDGTNVAYSGTPKFDKEYTFVLSDMDSALHQADFATLYQGGKEPNWTQYHPNYFFINGKAWPDTMKDPSTNITAMVGQTVLVRLVNAGYVSHAMHSHGFHFLVVGSDGRKLDQPYYKDTLTIGPAERYDVIFKLDQVGRFMFHDHFEQMTTNNGDYPGGMITMINVNNPDGSNPTPMNMNKE